MNRIFHSLLGIAGVLAAVGAGYWWGSAAPASPSDSLQNNSANAAGESGAVPGGRKLLYYRNPMGLPDTSPTPKKDSMGMDYLPVYEGEEEAGSGIKISTEKIQKLGVRIEAAERRAIAPEVRAAGRVEVDERRLATITPKFEGWVEKLYVNATGEHVTAGQPLFEVYSPELVSAQREYLVALKGSQSLTSLSEQRSEAKDGMRKLAQASLQRLKAWDISEEQIAALELGREPQRTLTFRAPATGIVTEKKAVSGMRFMPGEVLYQLADLSSVWVIADVFEQDIAQVKTGAAAEVFINAYAGEKFSGRVTYVYPTLKPESRTVQVRVELKNPGGKLKPGMFAEVSLGAAKRASVVTVPNSAVIDSGTRQVVLVQTGDGRFEPREVKLGQRDRERVEVLDAVKEGEPVVVAANFLLDAESNLKAALTGLSAPAANAGKLTHSALGKLDEIDPKTGALTISHEPVKSLNWPAMSMEFVAVRSDLFAGIKPGDAFRFEFIERAPGEWVVTKVERTPAEAPSSHDRHAR